MWLREAHRDVLSYYTADDLRPAEIYDAVRALPPEEPQNVSDASRMIQDSGAVGAAAGVRGEHHVRQMPQRTARRQRLVSKNVEPCHRQLTGCQSPDQSIFVHNAAARDIDERG
jgi:hypothetical protein